MQRITSSVWSHLSLKTQHRKTISEVRVSKPLIIRKGFEELVRIIALISFHNPNFSLFFRGQAKDHTDGVGKTSLMPAIYRKWGTAKRRKKRINQRFNKLESAVEFLRNELSRKGLESRNKIYQFDELAWAVLQHYEVVDTPLLDVTHSLRVACSFATRKNSGKFGYLFVLGLPFPHGSLSIYPELQLLNIRLLNICPPEALRPYFQNGYTLGSFPNRPQGYNTKLDFGIRLIAKFKFPQKALWSDTYSPIPDDALFPENDEIKIVCDKVKLQLK